MQKKLHSLQFSNHSITLTKLLATTSVCLENKFLQLPVRMQHVQHAGFYCATNGLLTIKNKSALLYQILYTIELRFKENSHVHLELELQFLAHCNSNDC